MVMTQPDTPPDPQLVARLTARFAETFETLHAGNDVFVPDVLVDLNVPVWRYQLQGRSAINAALEADSKGPVRIDVLRTVPTLTGFAAEHEEHQTVDGQELMARRLWLCEIRDGRIAEAVGYCSGEWDDALRARHAVEAPMIRW